MLELGERAGRRGRLPADGHGPAARARGRQRARDPRGARDARAARGPPDFTELVLDCGGAAARALRPRRRRGRGARAAREAAIADGSALERYERWVRAQGGDPSEDALPRAPVVRTVDAPRGRLRSTRCARSRSGSPRSSSAPAGARKDDAIDHAVGVVCLRKRGDEVDGRRAARRDPRATDEAATPRPTACWRRTSSATSPARERPIVLDARGLIGPG